MKCSLHFRRYRKDKVDDVFMNETWNAGCYRFPCGKAFTGGGGIHHYSGLWAATPVTVFAFAKCTRDKKLLLFCFSEVVNSIKRI